MFHRYVDSLIELLPLSFCGRRGDLTYQLVSAQRLDRESLRLTAADLRGTTPTAADGPTTSAATTPSLLPFAAALAVVSMAKAHDAMAEQVEVAKAAAATAEIA